MAKLGKNSYTTSKGEKKLNCYIINISKEVANEADLVDKELKIYAKDGKIIIDKK